MKRVILFGLAVALSCSFFPDAEGARRRRSKRADTEEARMEYKATDMLNRGLELIQQKQQERGLKLLKSVPGTFPQSKTRFRAYMAMGDFYYSKREYDLALKQYTQCENSEEEELQAEGLYRVGICRYQANNFDQAFVALRKVTADYPWSVFANEAYYYIGLCHFKLQRWARAAEALKLVGTSVEPNQDRAVVAEAGQRLFIKIEDEDLIVLSEGAQTFPVRAEAASGDQESITMELFGKSGINYMGSIETQPGAAQPGDGVLQVKGGDTVRITYGDLNTAAGKRNVDVVTTVRMVSTAAGGFTDGAYREYTKGVFVGQPFFMRVRDLDADVSDNPDTLKVTLRTRYTVKREIDPDQRGVDLEEEHEEIRERSKMDVVLKETAPHSGLFVGSTELRVAEEEGASLPTGGGLAARQDDDIVLEYRDNAHMEGDEARDVVYQVRVLAGDIQDVKIEHRLVASQELKARKDLIEARIFLKLGQIFKDVGLNRQASEKAGEGLARAESVIREGLKAGLDRELVEQAFNAKWDLLMVQDKLGEAIAVCNALIRMFPDSTLVDQALMRVAKAKLETEREKDRREAVNILTGVLRLKQSDLKPEAQFMMAELAEQEARARARARDGAEPDLSRALMAYKQCADLYPESPFAGESLDRIANYYLKTRDYARAVELIEQVFQDYPDAGFLDEMLLKWAIAGYRIGDLDLSRKKMMQLMSEYPGSKAAAKAEQLLVVVNRKMESQ